MLHSASQGLCNLHLVCVFMHLLDLLSSFVISCVAAIIYICYVFDLRTFSFPKRNVVID